MTSLAQGLTAPETGVCGECGASSCDHRVVVGFGATRLFVPAQKCQACERGAESTRSNGPGSRGALVLFEMSSGDDQWLHAVCAGPGLAPVDTLPVLFKRDDVFGEMDARYIRKRVWAHAAAGARGT